MISRLTKENDLKYLMVPIKNEEKTESLYGLIISAYLKMPFLKYCARPMGLIMLDLTQKIFD
jgi:hypothetical protein